VKVKNKVENNFKICYINPESKCERRKYLKVYREFMLGGNEQ